MSCGVVHRLRSDPKFLRLWWRLAATVPIQPPTREHPDDEGAGLKKKKKSTQIISFCHGKFSESWGWCLIMFKYSTDTQRGGNYAKVRFTGSL